MKRPMRESWRCCALVLALAAFVPVQSWAQSTAHRHVDAARDSTAIAAQSALLSASYVAGDIEALVTVYSPDGIAAPAGRDFIRGREALLELWALPANRKVIRHAATSVELIVDGDHAYDWGYYEGQVAVDGVPSSPFRGTYTIVWRREQDGVWRIAMDMWSALRN